MCGLVYVLLPIMPPSCPARLLPLRNGSSSATIAQPSPPLGTRKGPVIGDHIPPNKMVDDARVQRKAVEANLKHLPDLLRQVRAA